MKPFITERNAVSLALMLVAAALIASSYNNSYADLGGAFDPMFFPRIILGIWLVLSVINLSTSIMQAQQSSSGILLLRISILAIVTLAYALLLTTLGFLIISVIFSLVVLPLLGIKKPLTVLLFSALVPGSLVILFNHILTLPLPTSPFTYLF